jgi:hypothetical protein
MIFRDRIFRDRIQRRRRLSMLCGGVVLLGVTVTACIFDKSDYQGGGRDDKGATANTATGTASAVPTDTLPDADPTQPIGLDAGDLDTGIVITDAADSG